MLDDERRAVSEFELELSGKPGSDHLNIAKADAALEGGCWMDLDPDFALMHVNMTKEDVKKGVKHLQDLAPMLRSLTLAPSSASTGAQFRLRVRALIWAVGPQCPIVDGTPNEQVLAPARERVSQFEHALAGSEFVRQFEVAKADAEFERSVTLDTCLVSEPRKLELAAEESLRDVERQISELEAIMRR